MQPAYAGVFHSLETHQRVSPWEHMMPEAMYLGSTPCSCQTIVRVIDGCPHAIAVSQRSKVETW